MSYQYNGVLLNYIFTPLNIYSILLGGATYVVVFVEVVAGGD
jgi:hypothetical protein